MSMFKYLLKDFQLLIAFIKTFTTFVRSFKSVFDLQQ